MKQYEAVIKVMKENGGFATFGHLYQYVLKVPRVEWKTKTPFASIRRIVQDSRFFFKIRPGLWALKGWENRLPEGLHPAISKSKQNVEENHSYYQGLLVEIGNLKGFTTYIPAQDKNKNFLGKKLGDVTTVKALLPFGYESILRKARTIDTIWFNERKMPKSFFEIEHSGDIQNSLLKFVELQDFNTDMHIVADVSRFREFRAKLNLSAFQSIQNRVKFLEYNKVSDWHSRAYELAVIERKLS